MFLGFRFRRSVKVSSEGFILSVAVFPLYGGFRGSRGFMRGLGLCSSLPKGLRVERLGFWELRAFS